MHPRQLAQPALVLKLTLGLLIAMLVISIGIGGWLITADFRRQLHLARQKTDFVSNVSHELKTPLTSIRMFADLLSEGQVREESKRQVYLNIIGSETARLTRLINNVLDFSRIERGEKVYQMQLTDLGDLVTGVAEMLRPHLEAKQFRLGLHLPASPVYVHADPDALAQVIVNLLSNAEKYSGSGREIDLTLECVSDARVLLRVDDQGPGVPHHLAEKIFEQFFRAHDSLNSGIEGSGLGLTLARQIARAHGGDLTCQARPGGGTSFFLSLPRSNPTPEST
jgi:signal transduction histidine kinase